MTRLRTVGMLRGAWAFRDFISASVRRDFASRFLGTQLGWFWAVAQPLALIAVYTIVFAEIMKPVLPGYVSPFSYGIFLTAGIVLWGLFSDVLSRLIGVFVQNATLLKKVSVPKVTFPIIVVANALLHFVIVLALFLGFLGLAGQWPGMAVLGVVPVVALTIAFALGMGVLLGTVNVFFRDVEYSASLVLNFWFWLTPIVYPSRALPPMWKSVLDWNPMAPIVRAFQTIFLDADYPDWNSLIYPSVLAAVLLVLGAALFRRLSAEMVDEL